MLLYTLSYGLDVLGVVVSVRVQMESIALRFLEARFIS